jgi:hypothetical protein
LFEWVAFLVYPELVNSRFNIIFFVHRC